MKKLIAFSLAAAALSACILPLPHHNHSKIQHSDRELKHHHSEIYGEIKGGIQHNRRH